MTTISMLSGDWEIAFEDETAGGTAVAGLKMVRRQSGASETVITTNTLYSAIADAADDFQAMGFENPMLPVTPNAYTMENNYFIARRDTEYLKEGAITADWTVASGLGVYMKAYGAVTAAPVTTDIGRQVTETDSGDTGTLLDFETLPDGTTVIWIRPDTSGDTFADVDSQLECTSDSGAMNVTASAAAVSGQSLYASIQAIGSVPAVTEVYLYQERAKMTDFAGAFQWWATDPTLSLGIIDILIRVQLNDTSIADGDVEVFARRYTSLYDNFRLNVSAGGRSALPLASAADINNTTGYRYAECSSGVSDFDVGNYMYVGASWAAATKKGVITAVAGTATDPDISYYLIGDLTDFVGTDSIQEYDPITELDGDGSATVDAVSANSGGPTDATAGEGGTVTLALGGFLEDHTGDGTDEPYSVQFDCQTDVAIAKVYERMKYVTRRGATTTDLFGAYNIPGESYRGLEALYEYDAESGVLIEGDDVDNDNGSLADWTARSLHNNTTLDYITVTDQQTSVKSIDDDDLIYDESSNSVTVHEGGTYGFQSITSPKASPFGTFTGTQVFGARGVSIINFPTGDAQAYILTDDLGTLNNPPNTVTFSVVNTASGDRVLVARDTGTAGVINKDQFGGLAAPSGTYNGLGDQVIRVATSIDTEVPQSGYVRVVENALQQEHHYVYSSRTTGASGEFTLKAISTGTVTSDGVPSGGIATLTDTGSTFQTDEVEPGMLIRVTNNTKTTHVWEVISVTNETNLEARQLYGPLDATQDFDDATPGPADTFEINRLIGDHTSPTDYAATDDVFDLLLDVEATGTPTENTFIKTPTSNFNVVVNVRQGKTILPFTSNPEVNDNGGSATVVRTPDTIAV